jgi:hypothetical protein
MVSSVNRTVRAPRPCLRSNPAHLPLCPGFYTKLPDRDSKVLLIPRIFCWLGDLVETWKVFGRVQNHSPSCLIFSGACCSHNSHNAVPVPVL